MINTLRFFKNFFKKESVILKQEVLLKLALEEFDIDCKRLDISCDHNKGENFVNGIRFGIKYPISFFNQAQQITNEKKQYSFYFNGFVNDTGGREILLNPFKQIINSRIISSAEGRNPRNKGIFNQDYFFYFGLSKFGLCPHQLDWPGDYRYLWTYRFIESCFVGSIPVIFNETPLGENFTKGFYFVNSNEILLNTSKYLSMNFDKEIELNRKLAKNRFCFNHEEIKLIRTTI